MNGTTNLANSFGYVWPALFLGAVLPCGIILALFFSNKKKTVSFNSVLHGFGTFFAVLAAVAVLMLLVIRFFLGDVTVTAENGANSYIYTGGAIILALFWLFSEGLKMISFDSVLSSENSEFAGLTFGCGFVLAQNLLIFGLLYVGELDIGQSLAFGFLMLVSGGIYILISAVGYQLTREGQRFAGGAISILYFLLFALMLIFSNIYVTYVAFAAVLAFVLVIAYITLPLPFKGGSV